METKRVIGAEMIPTRRKISCLQRAVVAERMAGGLMANWGLANAKAIVRAMRGVLKAESERRKEKEQ